MGVNSQTTIANRHGYEKSFTAGYTQNLSGSTLLTPASGKSIKVKGLAISTLSTDGSVRVWFGDDENDQENTVATIYAVSNPGYLPVLINGDLNAPLKITSDFGDADKFFVLVNYTEE